MQIGGGEIDKHSYGTGIDEAGSLVHHENLLWIRKLSGKD